MFNNVGVISSSISLATKSMRLKYSLRILYNHPSAFHMLITIFQPTNDNLLRILINPSLSLFYTIFVMISNKTSELALNKFSSIISASKIHASQNPIEDKL